MLLSLYLKYSLKTFENVLKTYGEIYQIREFMEMMILILKLNILFYEYNHLFFI